MSRPDEVNIKFSIIIPVPKINDYIFETCGKLNNLKNKNFEIIIFPDEAEEKTIELEEKFGARIIPTGKVSPAVKRDLALEYAKGKYFAFTDDDAYPDANWLDIAEKYLQRKDVAAIGGPQLTPVDDTFWQKVSGAMFISPLSGKAVIRYWPGNKVEEVDDWPTVNFIVKREDFEKVGGFDTAYWPGEDTKLCLDIVKKLGKKILYIPELIVFHHRRSGFARHLKQTGNYGIHRGYFAKVFPETSRKLSALYFMPSVFVVFLVVGGAVSLYYDYVLKLYLLGIAVYLTAVLFSTIAVWQKTKNFPVSIAAMLYLISFHIWYGIRFIQGFVFVKNLKSKLGK